VYRPSDVAWDTITSHFFFVLHHPAAPPPICRQAARTLDDILAIVPHLQVTVQRRALDVLAQQIMLSELASSVCTRSYEPRVISYSLAGKRYSRCSVASPARPFLSCFAVMPFLTRSRASPTTLDCRNWGYSALLIIKIPFHHMMLMCDALAVSLLFRPSTCVSASTCLAIWSAGGQEYCPDDRGKSLLGRL
jgi:hypothetical protein